MFFLREAEFQQPAPRGGFIVSGISRASIPVPCQVRQAAGSKAAVFPLRLECEESTARKIVRRLRDAGHEALFAGGCVRDSLMGKAPHDFDIATSARPEQVASALPAHSSGRLAVRRRF